MSGGVDSSVAALLMRDAGYEVIGITMQVFDQGVDHDTGKRRSCCALDDTYDARRVAEKLEIPHYVISHESEFEEEVIRPYVEDYLAGRTPSPCVRCNTFVKFEALQQRARALGARWLVTGHYARLHRDDAGDPYLSRSSDLAKDQSYFLFGVAQSSFRDVLFPLGDYSKSEVRTLASEAGLVTAFKEESMETCFIGADGPAAFVEKVAPRFGFEAPKPGQFRDSEGEVLGDHKGVHQFTIGQRKGLGKAFGKRTYVTQIDSESGDVGLGNRDALKSEYLHADRCNWFGGIPTPGTTVRASIRHRHDGASAVIQSADNHNLQLRFLNPVFAVAPGQAVVLYQDEQVIGGGWIVSGESRVSTQSEPESVQEARS
jgi:tRNA-specific 2-thiouridylase